MALVFVVVKKWAQEFHSGTSPLTKGHNPKHSDTTLNSLMGGHLGFLRRKEHTQFQNAIKMLKNPPTTIRSKNETLQ